MFPANAFAWKSVQIVEPGTLWHHRGDWWLTVQVEGAAQQIFALQLVGQLAGVISPMRGQAASVLALQRPYRWMPVIESVGELSDVAPLGGTIGVGPMGSHLWGSFPGAASYPFDANGVDVRNAAHEAYPRFPRWKAMLVHEARPHDYLVTLFEVDRTPAN